MKYIELTIETSEAGIEVLTGALEAIGIEDTAVEDPRDVAEIMAKKETYEWDYIEDEVARKMNELPRFFVYLPDTPEGAAQAEQAKAKVRSLALAVREGAFGPGADLGTLRITEAVRDDSDWKDKWKAYFKPFRASDRLVVRPSWEEYQPKDGDLVIEIDPGMAFGTGTHETTSMCLALLDERLQPGQKVLDAGCGSGILAIAAAMLGAGQVLGVDVDREAVRVASENIEKNGVAGTAKAVFGDLTKGVPFTADLIVGNLMAELICLLGKDIRAHLSPGGLFIASGILLEKEEMVRTALTEAGFTLEEVRRRNEWCAMVLRRADA